MERTYREPAVTSSVAASEDDRNMHSGFDRWPRSFQLPILCQTKYSSAFSCGLRDAHAGAVRIVEFRPEQ